MLFVKYNKMYLVNVIDGASSLTTGLLMVLFIIDAVMLPVDKGIVILEEDNTVA
jgi:hypothetical protein